MSEAQVEQIIGLYITNNMTITQSKTGTTVTLNVLLGSTVVSTVDVDVAD